MKLTVLGLKADCVNPFRHMCRPLPVAIRQTRSVERVRFPMGAEKVEGQFTLVLLKCKCGRIQVGEIAGHWTHGDVVGNQPPLPDADSIIATLTKEK